METDLQTVTKNLSLQPEDNRRLASLCGQLDEHLKLIESRLGIEIHNRGHKFQLTGDPESIGIANHVLESLYHTTRNDTQLTPNEVHLALQDVDNSPAKAMTKAAQHSGHPSAEKSAGKDWIIRTKRAVIKPRGENQKHYVKDIHTFDVNFGIGPAGTGKTYLAVACAVNALEKDEVRRIVLVRPAVEAAEKLGFLPGDLAQKVDPYLSPTLRCAL